MIARGVTLDQLYQAAQEVGVRLVTNGRYGSGPAVRETKRGPEFRFNLATDSERFGIARDGGEGGAPYRRLSDRPPYRTIPGRCCWHGHVRFLAALFTLAPDAYVRTAMATYRGSVDFWRSYQGTFDVAAPYMGFHLTAPADQVCTCKQSDWQQEPESA